MAKKKPAKKAAAAKKKTAKRTTTTKKAAAKSARKAAGTRPEGRAGKGAAKKAAPEEGRRQGSQEGSRQRPLPKAAPKAAKKAAVRKGAAKKAAAKAAAKVQPRQHEQLPLLRAAEPVSTIVETERPDEEEETVETTSAGIQPLAPEHAAVDDLTSSGNELLDIFQKYDRNRTGSIEQAEFARLLEALGQNITDEELAIAFDIIDTDRTGKISWKQFKNWWTSR